MTRYPPHELRLRTDAEVSQPKLRRTYAEADKLRKKADIARQVGIPKLIQSGLSRHEAEARFDAENRGRT